MRTPNPDFQGREDLLIREDTVIADLLTWLTVHGCISLALRHPGYTGPSRRLALAFRDALGLRLVERGILTTDELAYAERVEAEESPHGAR